MRVKLSLMSLTSESEPRPLCFVTIVIPATRVVLELRYAFDLTSRRCARVLSPPRLTAEERRRFDNLIGPLYHLICPP